MARTTKSLRTLTAFSLAGAALTGCATDGASGSGDDSTSVPPGATMAEYQEAFDGLAEIELTVQTLGPKGSTDDAKDEEYMAAITEWSDGKITFDVNYAQSVAAGPEIDAAVSSGLLDIATIIPSYNPDLYPTFGAINTVSGLLGNDPAGSLLQAQAWWIGMAEALPGFEEEFHDQGLQVLMPGYVSAPHSLQCAEPRRTQDQLDGAVVRSSESKVEKLLESVGASAANVPTAEAFEALERGVVDCEVTSMRVSAKSGTLEKAKYVTTAPIGYNAATMVMNEDVWQDLPLVAKQLFHDRLDVYVENNLQSGWKASVEAVKLVEASGGSIADAEESVIGLFEDVHADLLAESSEEIRTAAEELATEWQTKAEATGIKTVSWPEFPAWFNSTKPDPAPFVDMIISELLSKNRPS